MGIPEIQVAHCREPRHRLAIALCQGTKDHLALLRWHFHLTAGYSKAGSKALQVPLPWARARLIEVVDVKDEAALGRGEEPEVGQMSITTELGDDARAGTGGEVVGHQ